MKASLPLLIIVSVVISLSCGGAPTVSVTSPEAGQPAPARHDVMYVCACGPECTCNSASIEPGTCTCGTELAWAHLVKVEGDEALLCTCAEGCSCDIDAEDESKCGCGSEARRVSFKGTGLHYCNCGGSCTCKFVSSEPGTCHCGMELVSSS